jgi:hypothetical protein
VCANQDCRAQVRVQQGLRCNENTPDRTCRRTDTPHHRLEPVDIDPDQSCPTLAFAAMTLSSGHRRTSHTILRERRRRRLVDVVEYHIENREQQQLGEVTFRLRWRKTRPFSMNATSNWSMQWEPTQSVASDIDWRSQVVAKILLTAEFAGFDRRLVIDRVFGKGSLAKGSRQGSNH